MKVNTGCVWLVIGMMVAAAMGFAVQIEASGALEVFVNEDQGGVDWYALAAPLSHRDSVTVRARVRLPNGESGTQSNLSGVQEIWLGGFAAQPGGRPDALAVAWTLDRSSWAPVWRLRLTSGLGLLPDPDPTNYYLPSAARPRPGAEYVVDLSYDRETGWLTLRLKEGETDETIVTEAIRISEHSGPVWPGVGIRSDRPNRLYLADLDVVPQFVPVGARLYMATRSTANEDFSRLSPTEPVDRRNELAFEVALPVIPISGAFSVMSEGGSELSRLSGGEETPAAMHLQVRPDQLAAGIESFSLFYEWEGGVWELDRISQSIGRFDARLSRLESSSEDPPSINGVISVTADIPTSTSATVRSQWTELHWDGKEGRFREGVTVEPDSMTFKTVVPPHGVDLDIPLEVPESEHLSVWRLTLSLSVEASGQTTQWERVITPFGAPFCGVRVMSFNILFPTPENEAGPNAWRHRRSLAMEVVRDADPAVIGFQEPWDSQLHDIDQALPEYERISVSPSGRWNNAIYFDTRRIALIEWGRFWHSDHPDVPGSSWGDQSGRATVWGHFLHRASGKRFYVFNTHLRAGTDLESDQERIRSAALLKEKVAAIAGDQPVFLLGDFNARAPQHPVHQLLTGGDGLRFVDTWDSAAWRSGPIGTNHQLTGYTGHNNRIDWILFRGAILPLTMEHINVRRGSVFPSDHLPIVGSFCLM